MDLSTLIKDKNTIIKKIYYSTNYHLADINIANWAMYFGSHNINTVAPFEKNYTIKSVTVHENYDPNSLLNDIALIYTNEEIIYNDHTKPICLPNHGHEYQEGQMCYLAGWGDTGMFTGWVIT